MATFYGGYDQVGFLRRSPLRISWKAVALTVATAALLVLIASDVSAIESQPAVVQVTVVDWYVASLLITTSGGFTMHASQTVTLSLTCSSICYRLSGEASVSPPFKLLHFAVTYAPDQYANATVQAPTTSYDGSLTITLGLA
jgi:hypothetical protein